MAKKKTNYKRGETIRFQFAGAIETGKIVNITKDSRGTKYDVYDGKYTYPVRKEMIL